MNVPKPGSMKNWDAGQGGGSNEAKKAKLFSTEASDAKDTMTGTNEQKEFVGKSGTPKGPFGLKGKEF